MQPAIQEAKPPYVAFETIPVEDRAASIAAGHPQYKDVDYAYITPSGSRDRIPQIVSEWFQKLEREVAQERFPASWFEHYKRAYEAWKKGQELPVDGLPLKLWGGVTPAQREALLAIHVRSVEELAAANEETIRRIGMGARELVQRAKDYLKAAAGPGKLASELAASRIEVQTLRERNDSLEAQVKQLAGQVQQLLANVNFAGQPPAPSGDITAASLLEQ